MTAALGAWVGVPCTAIACMVNHRAGRAKSGAFAWRFNGQWALSVSLVIPSVRLRAGESEESGY